MRTVIAYDILFCSQEVGDGKEDMEVMVDMEVSIILHEKFWFSFIIM